MAARNTDMSLKKSELIPCHRLTEGAHILCVLLSASCPCTGVPARGQARPLRLSASVLVSLFAYTDVQEGEAQEEAELKAIDI